MALIQGYAIVVWLLIYIVRENTDLNLSKWAILYLKRLHVERIKGICQISSKIVQKKTAKEHDYLCKTTTTIKKYFRCFLTLRHRSPPLDTRLHSDIKCMQQVLISFKIIV